MVRHWLGLDTAWCSLTPLGMHEDGIAGRGARVAQWLMTDGLMSRVLGLEMRRVREHSRIELDEHN